MKAQIQQIWCISFNSVLGNDERPLERVQSFEDSPTPPPRRAHKPRAVPPREHTILLA